MSLESRNAYGNMKIAGGTGCVMWFGALMDMRVYADGAQDLYVRLAESEIATFHYSDFICLLYNKKKPSSEQVLTKRSQVVVLNEVWFSQVKTSTQVKGSTMKSYSEKVLVQYAHHRPQDYKCQPV